MAGVRGNSAVETVTFANDSRFANLNTTVYEFDFYSGSQIGIYIGDILVDDVDSIQFSVSQSKRPIYGYASQYFHTVAAGQVIVQGAFTILFKEANYINATLARYSEFISPIEDEGVYKNLPKREDIERRMRREAQGAPPNENTYKLYRDMAAMPDQDFERLAETYADVLWKEPTEKHMTGNIDSAAMDFYVNSDAVIDYRRADQFPPVDIYVFYGDMSNDRANHTIKKLIDVHIIGQGQTLMVGGEPIQEQYQFFARNLT